MFQTLQHHAKYMVENGLVGQDCFVFENLSIDFDDLKKRYDESLTKSNIKKLELPIIFQGRSAKHIVSSFKGANSGNVSNHTFKTVKALQHPMDLFPFLANETPMNFDAFANLMKSVINMENSSIHSILARAFPFGRDNVPGEQLFDMVRKSVCWPVDSKKPTVFVHSILALNALNEKAKVWGGVYKEGLIPEHVLRFCILFWVLDKATKKLTIEAGLKSLSVYADISLGGSISLSDKAPIVFELDNNLIGVSKEQEAASNSIVAKFYELTSSCDAGEDLSLSIGTKNYSAPKTGKSPTNALIGKSKVGVLPPGVRYGINLSEIVPALDGYQPLLDKTSFSLDRQLTYYVFPQIHPKIDAYCDFIKMHVVKMSDLKEKLKKEKKESNGKEDIVLQQLRNQWEELWNRAWDKFKTSSLIFAFERDVGSANQHQYAWINVHSNLDAAKTFLLIRLLNESKEFGRLSILLKNARPEREDGWDANEKMAMIESYFSISSLNVEDCWAHWRKYLRRSSIGQTELDIGLWEDALKFPLSLKAAIGLQADMDWKGSELWSKFNERRRNMTEERKKIIEAYLREIHRMEVVNSNAAPNENEPSTKKSDYLGGLAERLASFIDTDGVCWKAVVDGIVAGKGLKDVCKALQEGDNYHNIIGGRNLSSMAPSEAKALFICKWEKALRKGEKRLYVDTAMERLSDWSLKNPSAPDIQFFTDALAMGFHGYH